jgi:hypothetical protein
MKAIETKICYNSYTIQKSSIKWTIKVVKPCDNCKYCHKEYNFDGWNESLCTKSEFNVHKKITMLKNDEKYLDDKYNRCIDTSVARYPDFDLCGIEGKYYESIWE